MEQETERETEGEYPKITELYISNSEEYSMEHPIILPYLGITPTIHEEAYIAPTSAIIGDVTIGKGSTIWFQCAIRGDVEPITIGEYSNIQDGTIIHVTRNGYPTHIGSYVTVGHQALLHACILEDESFVGMGATVMDGAVIEKGAMVAAGALVTPGKRVKTGELWAGRPAKLFRQMTKKEHDFIHESAQNYYKHGVEYRTGEKS